MRFSARDFSEYTTPIDIIPSHLHRAYTSPCYRYSEIMAKVAPREKNAKNRIGAKPGGAKNKVARTSMYKLMCLKVKDIRSYPSRKSVVLKVHRLGEIAICAI